jgi:hypothetical protein
MSPYLGEDLVSDQYAAGLVRVRDPTAGESLIRGIPDRKRQAARLARRRKLS